MAAKNAIFKSTPKQMSDSWIVIEDDDESDFVLIETENNKKQQQDSSSKTLINKSQATSGVKQNKKRKWKVLYSLPSTGVQGNVNAANLDSYVMDQHAQLYDKRDLFNSQQRFVKVK